MQRDPASTRQIEAADPANSTWLSANAGSGKTRVLTDRVARLLLDGTDPQNILCLTYTKAAASEMQNRLFDRLGSWAMMADTDLRQDLYRLGVETAITTAELGRARTLFARAIETPGGLKIQTIHSFCAGLLRRFPLEAGVSPQFTEMEDRAAALLRAEVVDSMALGPAAGVVDGLARYFTGKDFDALLQEISVRRDWFDGAFDEPGLRQALGLTAGLSADRVLQSVLPEGTSDLIGRLQSLLLRGLPTDVGHAARLEAVNKQDAFGWQDLQSLEAVFLTKSGNAPFTAKIGTFPTKALRNGAPDLMSEVEPLMEAVEAARMDRLRFMALDKTLALQAFARVFLPALEARKLLGGLLDFDDLIGKARALLDDPLVAQWVLFRLDGGIDHILVDEAQDTSPAQWAVIARLSEEFSSGLGARAGVRRTIFVVGDKKQSIYSFQGADPEAFDQMRDLFDTRLRRVGDAINPLRLDYSFRSAREILRAVDQTFAGPGGEGLDDGVRHHAFKTAMPGRVDLWPVIEADPAVEEVRSWTAPLDQISPAHHVVRLARQIASSIKSMVQSGTIPAEIGKTGVYEQRRITEGDILILLPRRSPLFAEIIRACKAADLQVAGADRLRVGAELAVRDIAALLRFLALAEDDLSLAAALKSPLFGWTEQMLFTLAQGRPAGGYLWQSLRQSDHAAALAVLRDLRDRADFLRPYDLINRILIRHGGRKALLARLGAEAEDGIDALLAQSLAYERTAIPGLTGFLEWMQTDDLMVKRQAEARGDRIRVMTVHGAKGLEAPIVILPDTGKRDPGATPAVMQLDAQAIWPPAVDAMPDQIADRRAEISAAQERERRRMLYVAMTRAENWLIVCAAGKVGEGDESWYRMIESGLRHAGAVDQPFDAGGGLRLDETGWDHLPQQADGPPADSQAIVPDLAGLDGTPPARLTTLSPSDLGGAKVLAGETAEDDPDLSLARGRLIHMLLEHLPQCQPHRRQTLADALVAAGPDVVANAPALIADVLAMLAAPGLGPVFAAGALAEVAVSARIPAFGNLRFHGAIDRLLVGPGSVTAIDFKSNRLVPATAATVPDGLMRQMGAYLAMLQEIYPDRPIIVAILWTATGELMPLPHDMLMEALSRTPIP